jgi:hypothetical protein
MGSVIFFSPNTHQQQHFATSFNAFRHTSSDAQNITLFFLRVPNCVGVLMPTSFTRMCELKLNADIFMNATYLEA